MPWHVVYHMMLCGIMVPKVCDERSFQTGYEPVDNTVSCLPFANFVPHSATKKLVSFQLNYV